MRKKIKTDWGAIQLTIVPNMYPLQVLMEVWRPGQGIQMTTSLADELEAIGNEEIRAWLKESL